MEIIHNSNAQQSLVIRFSISFNALGELRAIQKLPNSSFNLKR